MEQAPALDQATGKSRDKEGLCLLSFGVSCSHVPIASPVPLLTALFADGGGVRGLSSLYILRGLMTRVNNLRKARGEPAVKPCEVFDLIGGTSTGGLIAIMLGRLEMDVDECIRTYEELLAKIFKSQGLPVTWKWNTKARFDSKILRESIEDIIRKHIDTGRDPATEPLNNGQGSKVFVCATRHKAADRTPARLRSYKAPRTGLSGQVTISDAALATSAATTFFDPVTIGNQTFADGAFGANNPVEEVLAEAKDIWSPTKDNVGELIKCFVSIGTGVPCITSIESGAWSFMSKTLVNISRQTEKTAENFRRRHGEMFEERRIFRFNVQTGLAQVGLEEYKKHDIIETATELYMESEDHVVAVMACAENLRAKQSLLDDPEALRDTVRPRLDLPPKIVKAAPRPSPKFTGREKFLNRLDEFFSAEISSDEDNRVFLLHGMGGAGKTQICLKFAQKYRNRFSRVFWVDCANEETMKQNLKDIANHPDARSSGIRDSPEGGLGWLSIIDNWLLIFDNADGEPDTIGQYLPSGNGGNIMITSRNRTMRRVVKPNAYLEVDEMEKDDAILLLLRAAYLDESSGQYKAAASAIVAELHYLALAVDQAGAYIGGEFCQINQYLEIFSIDRIKLLDRSHWFKGASKYDRAVYTTFDISYEAIQEKQSHHFDPEEAIAAENAVTLLKTFSFFHYSNIMEETFRRAAEGAEHRRELYQDLLLDLLPWTGCDLPKDLLKLTRDHKWDPTLFKHAIQVLLSLSLVTADPSGETYSMHPLVHSWSGDRMSSSAVENSAACASAVLAGSIDRGKREDDYTYRRKLIPHVNAYYQFVRMSQIVTLSKDDEFRNYGLVFHESGDASTAEVLYQSAMKLRTNVLGIDCPLTLDSMGSLASTYADQGRSREAEELVVQVLYERRRVLGEHHPDTLNSMDELAATYLRRGQWKEAEKVQVHVVEVLKRLLGEHNRDTLASMNNLALTYSYQGRWKEAEELGEQVLDVGKRRMGEHHPDTLNSMNNLAATYSDQGRWKEAEQLEVQVLNARKRVLGENHLDTLSSMNNLASTYLDQGLRKEAEKLQVQVLDARKRMLGEHHQQTLSSMNNLALTYLVQGFWKKAEELQVRVLDAQKSMLGEHHPNTIKSMNNLAVTQHSLDHRDKAIEMMTSVIDLSKKIMGPNHPDTLTSTKWLDILTRTPPSTPQRIDATGTEETSSGASEGFEGDGNWSDEAVVDEAETDDYKWKDGPLRRPSSTAQEQKRFSYHYNRQEYAPRPRKRKRSTEPTRDRQRRGYGSSLQKTDGVEIG